MPRLRSRTRLAAPYLFALFAGALLLAGCDSDDPGEEETNDALFQVEVTDAGGAPVEGLRVGVRPCLAGSCEAGDVFAAAGASTRSGAKSNTQVPLDFFEAAMDGGDVLLTWETTSEEANEGFEIHRQAGGEDAFSQVGFVESNAPGGNSADGQAYQYRDPVASPGSYVYQLVQKSVSGAATPYEDDRATATVPVDGPYALDGPFPNPFQSRATLQLAVQEAQPVTVEVQELNGERVATLFDGAFDAVQTRAVQYEPAGDTPGGLYQIVTEGDTFADTAYAAVARTVDVVPRRLGTTGAGGTFSTDARVPFPAIFDPPMLERRNEINEQVGTFPVTPLVEITLTDPATGAQQTYERLVDSSESNAFSLDWTP